MTSQRCGKLKGLFGRFYAPQTDSNAAVVVSTGIHQHTGMYDAFSSRLASEGFAVLAYDHRGFGQSDSYAGMERSQILDWHDLASPSAVGDLHDAVLLVKELSQAEKVFVFGHSLGGLAAALLATCGSNPAAGFVLSGPSLCNCWTQDVINAAVAAAEEDPNGSAGAFDPKSATTNTDFHRFWASEEIAQYIELGMPFKAAYSAKVITDAVPAVVSRFPKFESPALLLVGRDDPFVGWDRYPDQPRSACDDLVQNGPVGVPFKLATYDGYKHDVIFEPGLLMEKSKNHVVDEVVDWLHQQTYHKSKPITMRAHRTDRIRAPPIPFSREAFPKQRIHMYAQTISWY